MHGLYVVYLIGVSFYFMSGVMFLFYNLPLLRFIRLWCSLPYSTSSAIPEFDKLHHFLRKVTLVKVRLLLPLEVDGLIQLYFNSFRKLIFKGIFAC